MLHRVDDIMSLPGPKFYALAWRLTAYQGVMAVRSIEHTEGQAAAPAPRPQPYAVPAAVQPPVPVPQVEASGHRVIAGTKEAIRSDPELSRPELQGLFSFSTAAKAG